VTDRPTLRTERLVMRPLDHDDAGDVEALAGHADVADGTLTIPHPYPPGSATSWIATHQSGWDAGTDLVLAITSRDDGTLMGVIGLSIDADNARAELGYWVGVPFWNQGYCTEAAGAVIDFAFSTLGLHRVHAHHFVRNPASGRVMQKVGMVFEGVQRSGVKKGDRFEDLASYAILSSDPR
jgi:[ribosomal protein S5]-alanine N-acetyltransferase